MALDKCEILDLLKLTFDEVYAAYKTNSTVTLDEWLNIAQKVGLQAFKEVVD